MKGRSRRVEKGRETERLREHTQEYLICWEMHGLGRQCPPQGTVTGVLLFDSYCQLQAVECTCKGKILLPECTWGGTQQQFPKWLLTVSN